MKTRHLSRSFAAGVAASVFILAGFSNVQAAGAVRTNAGFLTNTLAANDDGSTGVVGLGFSVNFYALLNQNSVFVNNNGNVTFTGALGTYTPFSLLSTATPMIAPFFADVWTFGAPTVKPVTYGTDTIGGQAAFGVNWVDVGYFANSGNPTNSFQLVMIDRSDIAVGDFDFEFNYNRILWETGGASGGSGGLGGSSARAGWSDGSTTSLELAGSAANGALLDGGPNALISGTLNSGGVLGRYNFNVRSGHVAPPSVPDSGSTVALLGLALAAMAAFLKKNSVRE